jgi:arylsulfate sulfotransferase
VSNKNVTQTLRSLARLLSLIGVAFLSNVALRAGISVTLAPTPAGPQPVGTLITWTATVQDTASGAHQYQFRVGPAGGATSIVDDFGQSNVFQWAFSQTEGTYQVRAVVQNTSNLTTAHTAYDFVVTSRWHLGADAVTPTANPLVALFSGPACMVGNFVRVRFNQSGSSVSQATNSIPCSATNSANFYIAGMYPNSQYQMHHETVNPSGGIVHTGPTLTFNTGSLPTNFLFPPNTVPTPAVSPGSTSAPILLHGYLPVKGPPLVVQSATDLFGNVLWYYPHPVGQLTRTEVGGKMFVLNSHQTNLYNNVLQEIDLAGNITLQTNVHRINEQLAAMTDPVTGKPRRQVNQFDHEIRRLSNGNIAVKASEEMLVSAAQYPAQCGTTTGTCDVIGAQVLILNPNLQVIWAWDAFDFLDINRPASLGEICHQGNAGCPVIFLAPQANDWLHMNAIQLTEDGSLLLSIRNQDWIIKINYANGTGDGSVLWRMGYQGDFTINNPPIPSAGSACTTPTQLQEYAWFTHQHDANFQFGGQTVLSLFDNGNLRVKSCDKGGSSRGYVLSVDESAFTVTPILIQALAGYSVGFGTAELIPGTSNYHFDNGWVNPGPVSKSLEITPLGSTDFEMDSQDVTTYRSYRMQDLYTPAPPL